MQLLIVHLIVIVKREFQFCFKLDPTLNVCTVYRSIQSAGKNSDWFIMIFEKYVHKERDILMTAEFKATS